MSDHVEVYVRTDGFFDWRRISENGQIVSTSGGQGYVSKHQATVMAGELNPGVEVTVTEDDKRKGRAR